MTPPVLAAARAAKLVLPILKDMKATQLHEQSLAGVGRELGPHAHMPHKSTPHDVMGWRPCT